MQQINMTEIRSALDRRTSNDGNGEAPKVIEDINGLLEVLIFKPYDQTWQIVSDLRSRVTVDIRALVGSPWYPALGPALTYVGSLGCSQRSLPIDIIRRRYSVRRNIYCAYGTHFGHCEIQGE